MSVDAQRFEGGKSIRLRLAAMGWHVSPDGSSWWAIAPRPALDDALRRGRAIVDAATGGPTMGRP